jgi:hypothetical protein
MNTPAQSTKWPEPPDDGGRCDACGAPRRGDLCITLSVHGRLSTHPLCANCALFPTEEGLDHLVGGLVALYDEQRKLVTPA